jgi:predicted phage-related endonuclease
MSKSGRALDAIGGSDIAAIRGESKYSTALDVWKRIVLGHESPPAGLPAEIGTAAEEAIVNNYCVRHGIDRARIERNLEVSLPGEPHFRGELDGFNRSTRVGMDAKLVLSPGVAKEWGEPGTDYMPWHILNQMAWYAMLADVERIDVVAVIYGRPQDYAYSRKPDYEGMILEDVRRFWRDHVVTKRPPPPQTVDDVEWEYQSGPQSDVRPATEAEKEVVAHWRDLRDRIKDMNVDLERAKAAVCAAIGESDGLWLGGDDRVTWKANVKGVRSLKG